MSIENIYVCIFILIVFLVIVAYSEIRIIRLRRKVFKWIKLRRQFDLILMDAIDSKLASFAQASDEGQEKLQKEINAVIKIIKRRK
jgi:hypothetical protein